jgi:hypothetical protein
VAALQDPDPANPIAVEVARLIAAYTNNLGVMSSGWAASPRTSFASNRAGPLKPPRRASPRKSSAFSPRGRDPHPRLDPELPPDPS